MKKISFVRKISIFSVLVGVLITLVSFHLEDLMESLSSLHFIVSNEPSKEIVENLLEVSKQHSKRENFENRSRFDKDNVLIDYKNLISSEFHIPENLKPRVSFWFDVYTKYGIDEQIIHSHKFPWLVLKVIDIAPIIYAETPSLRWLRNQKADKLVKLEMTLIKRKLIKISKMKNLDAYDSDAFELIELIKTLPGKVQKNALEMSKTLRIQTGQKEVYQEGLSIANQFLPKMENIFKFQDLPTELVCIPLVESSFNHFATSKAGASGIWQFMGNTGKKFLTVNDRIDERRSPIKSTYAAAALLKENYILLKKSWPLAITAYNHGPGGVRKAALRSKSFDLGTILQKYQTKHFGFATSNYYSEFLAALYAQRYQSEVFGIEHSSDEVSTEVVKLSFAINSKKFAQSIKMSNDEILNLNPDLRNAFIKNSTLPKGLKMHLPTENKNNYPLLFSRGEVDEVPDKVQKKIKTAQLKTIQKTLKKSAKKSLSKNIIKEKEKPTKVAQGTNETNS